MALSSPSRSPTYPFSAHRLAAIASRLPPADERHDRAETKAEAGKSPCRNYEKTGGHRT